MLDRLAREYERRSASDFSHWILSKIARRREHILFLSETDDFPPPAVRSDIQTTEINARNFFELEELRLKMIELNDENTDYLEDVRRGKAFGLALSVNSEVVHYAFVFRQNKTVCLLGLPRRCALIGNAFTAPAYRGRGLQAYSVHCRAEIAGKAGFGFIACETSPDNHSSQRGLEKAGMKQIGFLSMVVLLNRAVIRYRRPCGFSLFGLCC